MYMYTHTYTQTHTLRIIEPLTSRCSKFRFKPLTEEILNSRLEHIAKAEGVGCQPAVISKIVEVSEGDMRKAITFLQSVSRLKGSEEVTEEDIMEIAGVSVNLTISGSKLECVRKRIEHVRCWQRYM